MSSESAAGRRRAMTGHRRPRNSLSREEVVAAAVELVQDRGLSGLTVRGVAERLGASPMSLYRYVDDRDELLASMLDAASRDLPIAADDAAAPGVRLEARLVAAHDFFAQRMWIPHLLTRGDLVAPSTFGFADACIGDLIDGGLEPAEALFAFGTCWNLMLGELLDRHPRDLGARPTQRERALLEMDIADYPNYAHVLDNLDPIDGPPPDQFRRAARQLIRGILADGGGS